MSIFMDFSTGKLFFVAFLIMKKQHLTALRDHPFSLSPLNLLNPLDSRHSSYRKNLTKVKIEIRINYNFKNSIPVKYHTEKSNEIKTFIRRLR